GHPGRAETAVAPATGSPGRVDARGSPSAPSKSSAIEFFYPNFFYLQMALSRTGRTGQEIMGSLKGATPKLRDVSSSMGEGAHPIKKRTTLFFLFWGLTLASTRYVEVAWLNR